MKDHGTRSFAAYHMAAIVTLCLALGAAESAAVAGPVTGLDLVLWLDAQDIEGKGTSPGLQVLLPDDGIVPK